MLMQKVTVVDWRRAEMNLIILEDDLLQQERLKKFILAYLSQKKHSIGRMIVCGKTRQHLEELENISQNNIYFLETAIKGDLDAGLKVAQKIRKFDPLGQITFVTRHSEFATLTYEYRVNAHDVIDKKLSEIAFYDRIIANIEDFLTFNEQLPLSEVFTYLTRTGKVITALYSDIYFFETGNLSHQILLSMKSEVIPFYGSLTDIEKTSECLIRIHRNTVVNKNKIKRCLKKDKKIVLEDETTFYVSRSGRKNLREINKW